MVFLAASHDGPEVIMALAHLSLVGNLEIEAGASAARNPGEDRARAHAREIIEEFDAETGELTDNQDQIGGNGTDLPVEAATEKQAAGTSRPTLFNSPGTPLAKANSAGEAPSSSPASPARHSDEDIPAFLRRDEGRGYPKREAEAV